MNWIHLRRMFDPAILLLIAAISLGLTLASFARILGIPLALILISWFFKYAYALLDDVAFGVEQAPVLSVEMVNPVSQRPLGQLAIVLAFYAASLWFEGWLQTVLLVLGAFAAPASIAILGASGKFLQALNPWAWWTVMRALGVYYLGLLGFIAAAAALIYFIALSSVWLIVKFAILQFALLGVFNAIGAVLYERRDALDLDAMRSPERSQERADEEHARERARVLDQVYAHVRVKKYAQAQAELVRWLEGRSRGELRSDALEMSRASLTWNDPRATVAIADACIMRLYDARLIAEALECWELALNADPQYQLLPAEKAAALAKLAALAGKRGLARRVAVGGWPS